MAMNSTNSTVLFLGAGGSKVFGYPLTSEIFALLWKNLHEGSLFSGEDAEAESRELLSLLRVILPGLADPNIGGDIIDNILITDVLSFVDHLLLVNEDPAPKVEPKTIERLRKLIEKAILAVVSPAANQEQTSMAFKLAKWILSHTKTESPTSIISTNYDMSLEDPLYDQLGVRSAIPPTSRNELILGLAGENRIQTSILRRKSLFGTDRSGLSSEFLSFTVP
jgi:hypothetical protein